MVISRRIKPNSMNYCHLVSTFVCLFCWALFFIIIYSYKSYFAIPSFDAPVYPCSRSALASYTLRSVENMSNFHNKQLEPSFVLLM